VLTRVPRALGERLERNTRLYFNITIHPTQVGGNRHAETLAHKTHPEHRIHHLLSEQAQRVDARADGGRPGINDVESGRWMRFACAKARGVGLALASWRDGLDREVSLVEVG